MARIAGIVVIIIIAIIVNFVLKRIPNDSNIKRFTEMGQNNNQCCYNSNNDFNIYISVDIFSDI